MPLPTYASPLIFPLFRAFDNNGDPLAGGLLFSFITGTNTPTPTYADATLNTENANPVVLDAAGENPVWLDPEVTYKFVLEGPTGPAIWTANGINQSGVAGQSRGFVVVSSGITVFTSGVWSNMFTGVGAEVDARSEWDASTGTFEAISDGYYMLSYYGDISLNAATFTSGYLQPQIDNLPPYAGVVGSHASLVPAADVTKLTGGALTVGFHLTAGQTLTMGGALTYTGGPPQGAQSLLTIAQVA